MRPMGHMFTATQLLIIWLISTRLGRRVILILPTQYGKSLSVALGVLLRITTHNEKWAIIAPTEDKARIIMDYIIQHIFDAPEFYGQLDYSGTLERLKQERGKTRLTFRHGGEVRVYTADASNSQNVKKALMGFGSPNIILDESGLIPDDLYSTIKRMLGGTKDNFLLEIGNPFFRNHFYRMWLNSRYVRIFIDVYEALKEGRYTEDYIAEMRDEAFFDVLYECHFPEQESEVPTGYFPLLSSSFIENAFIEHDLPLGYDEQGNLLDTPILGIDPNHGGSNFTVAVVRYPLTGFAKVVLKKQYADMRGKDITSEQLSDIEQLIRELKITDYRIGIDAGNGGGLADALIRKGYLIQGIMFGEQAEDSSKYANRKAELFWNARKWIRAENGKLVKHGGFLDLKVLNYKETTTSKLQMEPKADLAKRGIASPDVPDAFALTFVTTADIMDDDDDVDII